VKLPHLRKWSEKRIENARQYNEAFAGLSNVVTPVVKDYSTFHIFNQYTIRVPDRDAVVNRLKDIGIGCEVYYPVPFHKQECFAYLGHKPGAFPESARAADEVLSIPIYPDLTRAEQDEVIDAVKRLVG
jgi:dTDP-4-amino-4,6-dideoxygalactose transaminase